MPATWAQLVLRTVFGCNVMILASAIKAPGGDRVVKMTARANFRSLIWSRRDTARRSSREASSRDPASPVTPSGPERSTTRTPPGRRRGEPNTRISRKSVAAARLGSRCRRWHGCTSASISSIGRWVSPIFSRLLKKLYGVGPRCALSWGNPNGDPSECAARRPARRCCSAT
jgi:hypothetical protein